MRSPAASPAPSPPSSANCKWSSSTASSSCAARGCTRRTRRRCRRPVGTFQGMSHGSRFAPTVPTAETSQTKACVWVRDLQRRSERLSPSSMTLPLTFFFFAARAPVPQSFAIGLQNTCRELHARCLARHGQLQRAGGAGAAAGAAGQQAALFEEDLCRCALFDRKQRVNSSHTPSPLQGVTTHHFLPTPPRLLAAPLVPLCVAQDLCAPRRAHLERSRRPCPSAPGRVLARGVRNLPRGADPPRILLGEPPSAIIERLHLRTLICAPSSSPARTPLH